MTLEPDGGGGRIELALADVYAAAITGVTGINPWEGPTSLDPAEAGSAFALHAREDAAANAELAARTGWALYLTTEAFHRMGLSDSDYDAFAEELLLKSAAMVRPNPGFSSGRSLQRPGTEVVKANLSQVARGGGRPRRTG